MDKKMGKKIKGSFNSFQEKELMKHSVLLVEINMKTKKIFSLILFLCLRINRRSMYSRLFLKMYNQVGVRHFMG